jgi:prophage regulatory protein
MDTQLPDTILRRPEVQKVTGLSRATIYESMARGDFPVAIRLGKRAVGWPQSEITHWLATRPRSVVMQVTKPS